MDLDCPRCPGRALTELRVTTTGGVSVQVHLCEQCKGVWLDGPTLMVVCPTLAHLPEHRDEIALTGAKGAGIGRCLRCAVPPFEYRVLGVAIDFCLRCHGVWLDGDEYEESMLSGAEPVETRGGPYRRAASNLASGEVKCAYCGHSTDPKKAYVRELGPACSACHFAQEQRQAELRATTAELGAQPRGAGGAEGFVVELLRGVRELLGGSR